LYPGPFELCGSSQLLAAAHISFQLLDKQPNFVFGLAGACAPCLCRSGFAQAGTKFSCVSKSASASWRQLADAEPANFDDARFLRQYAKELGMNIMFFLS